MLDGFGATASLAGFSLTSEPVFPPAFGVQDDFMASHGGDGIGTLGLKLS